MNKVSVHAREYALISGSRQIRRHKKGYSLSASRLLVSTGTAIVSEGGDTVDERTGAVGKTQGLSPTDKSGHCRLTRSALKQKRPDGIF